VPTAKTAERTDKTFLPAKEVMVHTVVATR